jgi:hypothetical protein
MEARATGSIEDIKIGRRSLQVYARFGVLKIWLEPNQRGNSARASPERYPSQFLKIAVAAAPAASGCRSVRFGQFVAQGRSAFDAGSPSEACQPVVGLSIEIAGGGGSRIGLALLGQIAGNVAQIFPLQR